MTDCEHLIESALMKMKKAKDMNTNVYESFQNEMSLWHTNHMLNNVNMTKEELWQIAQYIIYVWDEK